MIIKNLIYIYQLENYDKKRFLSFVFKNANWFGLSKRGELDWTIRALIIFVLSILLSLTFILVAYLIGGLIWLVVTIVFCLALLPFIVIVSDVLVSPLVVVQKKRMSGSAREIIQTNKKRGMITIGITGSFGKTSMKNVLIGILSQKYSIFTFPGNTNTDIGIAQYIIKHQDELSNINILISEMGAHRRGEIKKLCDIIDPDYSILTSIGESHLERFGSFRNIVLAKFELANATKKKVFLNVFDDNIRDNFVQEIYSDVEVVPNCGSKEVEEIIPLENFEGITFEYQGECFQTSIIADYVVDYAIIAMRIGKEYGLTYSEMRAGILKVRPIPHRLEVIKNSETNRVIIDDSYNGNMAGFKAGLNLLERASGRKVVLTPGIVELGRKRSREVHHDLAERYAEMIDLVLLVETQGTEFIVERFVQLDFNNYLTYSTTKKAHDDLANVLRDGDTIIFQNDITDNYLT